MAVSVNKHAMRIVKELITRRDELQVRVEKRSKGATIIDAGVEALGGYAAGQLAVRTCMADLCEVALASREYGDFHLPTITVTTDKPAISALASQFAGWEIKTRDYFGIGSGPARALALKPREIYAEIEYKDKSDTAIIVLESDKLPTDAAISYIAAECHVRPSRVFVIVTPTNSIAGSIQISGRIVEIGIYKLRKLGFDPRKIMYAFGSAPIPTVHPKSAIAMGRANDALYYGGETYYAVSYEDDEKLKQIVSKVPSSTADEYGKPFYEIFKAAGFNFYKIDENLFAPATVTINNIKTGNTFRSGRINTSVLRETMAVSRF